MKLYQKFQLLGDGRIAKLTLEECNKLITFSSYDVARIIRKLVLQNNKCYLCKIRNHEIQIVFRSSLRKICGGCHMDVFYGNIK